MVKQDTVAKQFIFIASNDAIDCIECSHVLDEILTEDEIGEVLGIVCDRHYSSWLEAVNKLKAQTPVEVKDAILEAILPKLPKDFHIELTNYATMRSMKGVNVLIINP